VNNKVYDIPTIEKIKKQTIDEYLVNNKKDMDKKLFLKKIKNDEKNQIKKIKKIKKKEKEEEEKIKIKYEKDTLHKEIDIYKKNLFKLSDENKKLKEKMSMIENTKINNNNYNNYNSDKEIYMKIKDYDNEIKEIKKDYESRLLLLIHSNEENIQNLNNKALFLFEKINLLMVENVYLRSKTKK